MPTEDFLVDGARYRLIIRGGNISFRLISGKKREAAVYDKYDLFKDEKEFELSYGDINLIGVNPFKVLSRVQALVIQWIFKTRPHSFRFSSTTERKKRFYDRLVLRTLNQISKVNELYYCYHDSAGSWTFYRKDDAKT